jgi:hypothetical protein
MKESGVLKIEESESEVLKIEESESELLCTDSTALPLTHVIEADENQDRTDVFTLPL